MKTHESGMTPPSFEKKSILPVKVSPERQLPETKEMKNGLPVMDAEEYIRMYNTDVRHFGEDVSATFNFQGYVKETRPDYEAGMRYTDALATNGILKELGGEGIHVGTDGVIEHNSLRTRAKGPEDIGEYEIFITIPPEVQKAKGVYCLYDSCTKLEDRPDYVDEEDAEEQQKKKGWLVIRLSLDPKIDPNARIKAATIHEFIVKHLQDGGSPAEIEDLTRKLEYHLTQQDEGEKRKLDS